MIRTPKSPDITRFDHIISKKGGDFKSVKCDLVGDYSMDKNKKLLDTLKDEVIRSPSDHIGVYIEFIKKSQ